MTVNTEFSLRETQQDSLPVHREFASGEHLHWAPVGNGWFGKGSVSRERGAVTAGSDRGSGWRWGLWGCCCSQRRDRTPWKELLGHISSCLRLLLSVQGLIRQLMEMNAIKRVLKQL